jgi:hypothetical protein
MQHVLLISIATCLFIPSMDGQRYYTKVGRVSFLSAASIEKIEATNSNALVVLDASSGNVECSVLIKGFQFAKALMQEHFNENYMESHEYPKGIFKGTITNMQQINLAKDGIYTANLRGALTLHGVTRPLSATGRISVKGGKIAASTAFEVMVSDYNIKIPKVVRENIAEKIMVTVSTDLLLMN